MTGILFICHGNICRSPMAQCVMTQLVRERGLAAFYRIGSAAVSDEEEGHGIYPPARAELRRHGIPAPEHRAHRLTREEAAQWELLIAMDEWNLRLLRSLLGPEADARTHLLMEYTGRGGEMDDPWYTRRFDRAYEDILEGCTALLDALEAARTGA